MSKPIFRSLLFNCILAMICFTVSVVVVVDDNSMFVITAALPIAFWTIYLISSMNLPEKTLSNLGYILFFAQSFVKCAVAPLFLVIGNYCSLFGQLTDKYIVWSVFLLIYEQFSCTIVIHFTSRYRNKYRKSISIVFDSARIGPGIFIILVASFMILLWITVPSISDNFVTIFNMISSKQMFLGNDYQSNNLVGTSGRTITTLFIVLFKSVRIIIPFYLIKHLKEKYNNKGSFIASLIVILLQFVFISGTVLSSLIAAFILLSYMARVYKQYRKYIVIIMSFSVVFVVFVLSLSFDYFVKWFGVKNVWEYISQTFQSYVPGVCNTASIFRVARDNRWDTFFDTIISAIPFQSTIFGTTLFSNDLNTIYTSTSGLGSQIVSTIAGGWYILGPLFAPAFSMLFTRVSFINGYKYENTDQEWKKLLYLYMCIQSMLGIGIYNIQITLSSWVQVGFVLLICTRFSSKRISQNTKD